jgi:hypothetical protein
MADTCPNERGVLRKLFEDVHTDLRFPLERLEPLSLFVLVNVASPGGALREAAFTALHHYLVDHYPNPNCPNDYSPGGTEYLLTQLGRLRSGRPLDLVEALRGETDPWRRHLVCRLLLDASNEWSIHHGVYAFFISWPTSNSCGMSNSIIMDALFSPYTERNYFFCESGTDYLAYLYHRLWEEISRLPQPVGVIPPDSSRDVDVFLWHLCTNANLVPLERFSLYAIFYGRLTIPQLGWILNAQSTDPVDVNRVAPMVDHWWRRILGI